MCLTTFINLVNPANAFFGPRRPYRVNGPKLHTQHERNSRAFHDAEHAILGCLWHWILIAIVEKELHK